jgi:hypothetical protein
MLQTPASTRELHAAHQIPTHPLKRNEASVKMSVLCVNDLTPHETNACPPSVNPIPFHLKRMLPKAEPPSEHVRASCESIRYFRSNMRVSDLTPASCSIVGTLISRLTCLFILDMLRAVRQAHHLRPWDSIPIRDSLSGASSAHNNSYPSDFEVSKCTVAKPTESTCSTSDHPSIHPSHSRPSLSSHCLLRGSFRVVHEHEALVWV